MRGLPLLIKLEDINLCNYTKGQGKGWAGGKLILHQIPRFFGGLRGYIYSIPFIQDEIHTRWEVRSTLLNGKLEISPILTGRKRKVWGVVKSILHRITPFLLEYKKVHLYYLNTTRWEVCIRLFNSKLPISSVLAQGWRKDDMQVSQSLVKSLNYFWDWDEYSSTWTK